MKKNNFVHFPIRYGGWLHLPISLTDMNVFAYYIVNDFWYAWCICKIRRQLIVAAVYPNQSMQQ